MHKRNTPKRAFIDTEHEMDAQCMLFKRTAMDTPVSVKSKHINPSKQESPEKESAEQSQFTILTCGNDPDRWD